MNKSKKQEQFFNRMKDDLKTIDLDAYDFKKYVYTELIKTGVEEEQTHKDLCNEFNDWDNKAFKECKNIDNFYDPYWPPFYQFHNRTSEMNVKSAIKLYIPMDEEHIYEGIIQLFEYMDKENIPTYAKVRNRITLDNVVIRVNNIEDAEKIINYVNNNQYLKEGLIDPNPFLISKDNIGLAIDGYKSYNSVITNSIADYLYENKDNLDNISLETFKEYLEEKQKELKEKSAIENDYDKYNIIKLALKSINDDSNDYDDYKEYAYNIKYPEESEHIDNKEILDSALEVLINKYGTNIATKHLMDYINTGNYKLFSRDNNSRKQVKRNLTSDIVKGIIESELTNNNYSEYIDYLVLGKENRKIRILNEASIATNNKYSGTPQLEHALKVLIYDHDYCCFTNDNNARINLKSNVSSHEVLDLMEKHLNINGIDCENKNIDELVELYKDSIIAKETLEIKGEITK